MNILDQINKELKREQRRTAPERKAEKEKQKALVKDVKEAIAYFVSHGFIEELTTDKKYFVEKLIEYSKQNLKNK